MTIRRWIPAMVLIWLVVYLAAASGMLLPVDQILAGAREAVAESLGTGGHTIVMLTYGPPLIVSVGLGFILLLMGGMSLRAVLAGGVGISCLMELLAFMLQAQSGIAFGTALIHIANIGYGVLAVARELSLRRSHATTVAYERDATRGILDHIIADNFDGVLVIDRAGTIIAASRMAEEMLGGGRTLVGEPTSTALPRAIRSRVNRAFEGEAPGTGLTELPVSRDGGEGSGERVLEYTVTRSDLAPTDSKLPPQPLSQVVCVTFRDITERQHNEQQLTFLANHDPLTGALTRLRLVQVVGQALSEATGQDRGLTMMVLNLSRFKAVNGIVGHVGGDIVLRQTVNRLKEAGFEHVTRLGGDSFAATIGRALADDEVEALCQETVDRLVTPYAIGEQRVAIGVRMGVTTTELSGFEPETLLRHADMALGKTQPGSRFEVFRPEMDDALKHRQQLDLALRQAIVSGELTINYQPQVYLETAEVIGVEALARWRDKSLGDVRPDIFIPAAEESGLIVELGRFVLNAACRDMALWSNRAKISINVSPIQFELSDLVADVKEALTASALPPERLELEITEGTFISNSSVIEASLNTLRAMGVTIAVDDFGTGYSTLSYLGRLPIDKIKIDQSFVRRLPGDQEAVAIIKALLALSDSLGKVVIAEGVETAEQAALLRLMGCRFAQGYHFGRPMPAADVRTLFATPGNPMVAMGGRPATAG